MGGVWTQEAKLVPFDASDGQHFGTSVAIDGDVVAVGSPDEDNTGGIFAGSVYVYRKIGGSWLLQDKLLASDGSQFGRFGWDVALAGNVLAVGSIGADSPGGGTTNTGAVYIFRFDGANWTEDQIVYPSDPTPGKEMGETVALAGTTLVSGATNDPTLGNGAGAAYVFEFDGNSYVQTQKLFGSDTDLSDRFGTAITLSPPTLVVGALNNSAAYVFGESGGVWTEQARLEPPVVVEGTNFGASCALSGNRLAVGEPGLNNGSGGINLFTRSGGGWVPAEVLEASISDPNANTGRSLALEGGILLAASPFDHPGGVREAGTVAFFSSSCDSVHVQSLSIEVSGTTPIFRRQCFGRRRRSTRCFSRQVGIVYSLRGEATLLDQNGDPVSGAEIDLGVSRGRTRLVVRATSDSQGMIRAPLGTVTRFFQGRPTRVRLQVRDVRKSGFTFDRAGSVLDASRSF